MEQWAQCEVRGTTWKSGTSRLDRAEGEESREGEADYKR